MNLLNHVMGIIIKPKHEWLVIREEPISTNQLFTGYVAILALIPAVAYFIGSCFVGIKLPDFMGSSFSYKVPIVNGLIYAVVSYIMNFVGIYLSAFIINALAPHFESTQNMNNALKLVAFSYTPIWIAGIAAILPALSFLSIFGLYGLYLLYIGLEPMMGTPPVKIIVYLVIVLLVLVVVYMVIGLISSIFVFSPTYQSINSQMPF
jgi:hypothetical protein